MGFAFFPPSITPFSGLAPTWGESGSLPPALKDTMWGPGGLGYHLQFEGNPRPVVYHEGGEAPTGFAVSSDGYISPGPFTESGSFNPILWLYNGVGPAISRTFSLAVSDVVTNPTITSGATSTGVNGSQYNEQLVASGTSPIVWDISSGALPTGLTMTVAGLIEGIPTVNGIFNYTVRASNNAIGGTTPATLARTTTINQFPFISTTLLDPLQGGSAWSGTLGFGGYPAATVTATYLGGALPGTLAVSSAGVFSGTHNVQGTYNILFTVTNALGVATRTLPLTIQQVGGSVTPCPGSFFSWNNNGLTTPVNKTEGSEITAIFDIAGGILNFNRTNAPGTTGPTWDDTQKALKFRATPLGALRALTLDLETFPCWAAFRIMMLSSNPEGILGFLKATNVFWHYERTGGASDRFGISAGEIGWGSTGQFDDGYVDVITEFVDATHGNIRVGSTTQGVISTAISAAQLDFILNHVGKDFNLKAIAFGKGALNTIGA